MNGHPIRAFLLSPLVPPVVYWALAAHPRLRELPAVLFVGAIFTYPAIFIGGLPIYLFIRTRWALNAIHALVASAAVGAATFLLLYQTVNATIVGQGAGLGATAGLAFWLLWRDGAHPAPPRLF